MCKDGGVRSGGAWVDAARTVLFRSSIKSVRPCHANAHLMCEPCIVAGRSVVQHICIVQHMCGTPACSPLPVLHPVTP
jgi:hypothetical protein